MSASDELNNLSAPLVVYVGPGLADDAGLPNRPQLARALLAAATDMLSPAAAAELSPLIEAGELTDVFTELSRAMTPAGFGRAVEQQLGADVDAIPALGKAVAALSPRLRGVITPNLDNVLERAFLGDLQVHTRPTADLASRTGWLLKLHGTLRDRSTWVFTDEEQGRVLHRDPVHREVFRSLFLAHPILFVGTSMDDPVLVDVVEQIQALAQGQPPRHWAIVDPSEATPIRRRKLAAAGIELIPCSAAETPALLGQLVPGATAATTAPAPAVPTPAPPPVPTPTSDPADDAFTVLFVAANPSDTDRLRVDQEFSIIQDAIRRSAGKDRIKVEICGAATPTTLARALIDHKPRLVHLAGHAEKEGVIVEGEGGVGLVIESGPLSDLFAGYTEDDGPLRCVLLNACNTLKTGERMADHVPVTIAMDGPIHDSAALAFTEGFYDAIGDGQDFAKAYREGVRRKNIIAKPALFDARLLPG